MLRRPVAAAAHFHRDRWHTRLSRLLVHRPLMRVDAYVRVIGETPPAPCFDQVEIVARRGVRDDETIQVKHVAAAVQADYGTRASHDLAEVGRGDALRD